MSFRSRCALSAVIVAVTLALGASAAVGRAGFRLESEDDAMATGTYLMTGGGTTITCRATAMALRLHSLIAKAVGQLAGFAQDWSQSECRDQEGRAAVVRYLDPGTAHLAYVGFVGDLPTAERVIVQIDNFQALVELDVPISDVDCLYLADLAIEILDPITGADTVYIEGSYALQIQLSGLFSCPESPFGAGTLTLQPQMRLSLAN